MAYGFVPISSDPEGCGKDDGDAAGCGVPISELLIGAGDAALLFFFFFFFLQPSGFDLHGFGVADACGWTIPDAPGIGVEDGVCPNAAPVARETLSMTKENVRKNFNIAIKPLVAL